MKICPRCSELFGDDAAFCPHDGSSLEKSKDRFLGRTVAARYRLVRRLGAGGMSVVYLARHELISRLSAIKILRPELSLITEHRERFLREARAVNRINHDNIVEITDVGESDGIAYLVMEFIEGESLLAHIERGRLPWASAARIGMQVASALARAHQMGIIHRDLKPENILLVKPHELDTESEHVKLTDFGIAKVTGEPSLTMNAQLFGTPGYIAPEYVGGLGIDGRSDIYSLAVVIYEMVCGALPFEGKGQLELLLKPLTAAPIPPGQRVAGLPPELESLLLRCLAREPNHRPHDAFAMHDALAGIVRRYSVTGPASAAQSILCSPPTRTSKVPPARDPLETLVVTHEMNSRWSTALADLELGITKARNAGGTRARSAARAAELAEVAREMVPRVERAAKVVGELLAKTDRLEARGREFRTNLGHAIDVLVHDRSRDRARLDALRAQRPTLERAVDPRARELDALLAEEMRAAKVVDDLSFQLDALQGQLDAKNEEFERELVQTTGQLEGSLSALRRLSSELVRTIDDGMGILQRAG